MTEQMSDTQLTVAEPETGYVPVFGGVGPVRLELVASTPYRSGVLWLRYRPATG